MKALKEKRVSLRSLFRRSLIILSLFALVFAACSDSESEGPVTPINPITPIIPPNGNGTVDPPPEGTTYLDYVTRIEVLQHPTMYSFEGAAPDLTGVKVALSWKNDDPDGKGEWVQIVDITGKSDPRFYVFPPFALIDTAGTSITAISAHGDYWLNYCGGLSTAKETNLYIPAVVALADLSATPGTDPAVYLFKLEGSFGEILEDQQEFDTSKVTLRGQYAALAAGLGVQADATAYPPIVAGTVPTGTIPRDYGRVPADFKWAAVVAGEQTVPVSSHPAAWELARTAYDGNVANVLYMYDTTPAVASANRIVKIDKFFYVDKLVYKSGAQDLKEFIADELVINGSVNWVSELTKAGIEFDVIYYTSGSGIEKTRTIGMADYVRAMYTLDRAGDPRATAPVLTGNPTVGGASSILSSVVDDYELEVQLFYYNPSIKGAPGEGAIDIPTGTPWPVAANVPVTSEGKIFVYNNLDMIRKPDTGLNENAEILAGGTVTELVRRLQTLWDVVYVYVNPNDSSKTINSKPISWNGITVTGFDNSVPDETKEERDVDITFALPGSEGGTDSLTFYYDVKK